MKSKEIKDKISTSGLNEETAIHVIEYTKKTRVGMITSFIIMLVLLIGFIVTSTLLQSQKTDASAADKEAEVIGYYDISLIQLLSNPEKYHGKTVRVYGFATLESSKNRISYSKDSDAYLYDSISISLGESLNYEETAKYNGGYVRITGVFDMNDKSRGGIYRGSIKDISEYTLIEEK